MSELQQEFAHAAAALILKAGELGYGVTLGEAWRSPQQAQWDADHHTGVAHSLHTQRLAIDLNLIVNGVYQADDSSGGYSALGAWWKSLQSATAEATYAWGGDFRLADFGHFSLSPDGVHE